MNAYIPEASTCGVTEAALAALSLKRNSSKFLHHLLVHDSMPIFSNADTSETGAQQMLLDTQAIITILLDIPNLGRHMTSTASYTKFVTHSVANTYRALLPKRTPMEFQRILEFKV
ncbi:hypothetical protein QYF36_023757 [Acer negundo]|nr:hypothetical protein QYF36_023757 [Acer negundo]